jgi:predicted ATP-dependent serine protease
MTATWKAWVCTVDGCGYLQPRAFGPWICPRCQKPLTLRDLAAAPEQEEPEQERSS